MDQWLKIVFCDADNVHLALGVFHRVGGVGGVDHDALTKFPTDRPGRCRRRVGRPEDFANLENRINPLIHEGDALLISRNSMALGRGIRWDGCPP